MKNETLYDFPKTMDPVYVRGDFEKGNLKPSSQFDDSRDIQLCDVGHCVLESIRQMDHKATWKYQLPKDDDKTAFWTVRFISNDLAVQMTMHRYKGAGQKADEVYFQIRVKGSDQAFDEWVLTYLEKLGRPPAENADWDEFGKTSGVTRDEVANQWEEVILMPLMEVQVQVDNCLNRDMKCDEVLSSLDVAKTSVMEKSYTSYRQSILDARSKLSSLESGGDVPVLKPME